MKMNRSLKEIVVADAELSTLPDGRRVFEKRGNIFFLGDRHKIHSEMKAKLTRARQSQSGRRG
eukprot:CAMPEP_0167776462 /NCGR_PEP_ID=MMETSP0111_2-20121227/3140_1 /TAXON_ID=91324 /ORGANISM="Lotharella globosa, Strain CCCM811" /LENGTH=62 /DNA_ID=CAMNT_0007666515 /DNA_START=35 /DNA_END=223 /DNA_ORIENTATION=+